jgi:hypothetical protein
LVVVVVAHMGMTLDVLAALVVGRGKTARVQFRAARALLGKETKAVTTLELLVLVAVARALPGQIIAPLSGAMEVPD